MPTFVVSHSRAGPSGANDVERAVHSAVTPLKAMAAPTGVSPVSAETPRRRIVFVDCSAAQASELRNQYAGSLFVEPLMRRGHPRSAAAAHIQSAQTLREAGSALVQRESAAGLASLNVTVRGSGKKLKGVVVTLVLTSGTVLTETTGSGGKVTFRYRAPALQPQSVSTSPIQGYWTVAQKFPSDPVDLTLPAIEFEGPCGWWQREMGVSSSNVSIGKGIRIAVVDSGVGPHPCLSHVTLLGSMIKGRFDPRGGADVDHHGTEVTGLIGSRARSARDLTGIAPGVEVVAIRVFPRNSDANQADVAAAIDRLVDENEVDLINLSLSGNEMSQLERDAIAHAYSKGTLCICAAGDNAGPICYPASYLEAVSVAALGKVGWGPPGSIAAQLVATSPLQSGGDDLFLAPFSSRGNGLSCSAPGLGLISTFPSVDSDRAEWGEDSGTSLSAPLTVGVLAAILSRSPTYLSAPRERSRADLARRALASSCRTLGISTEFQGKGIPTLREPLTGDP
jgi:subtilisin family serine protease